MQRSPGVCLLPPPFLRPHSSLFSPVPHRDDAVQVLADALATVSKPGKGGAVRDVLAGGYPKLAQLLEAAFDRLASETTMKVCFPPTNIVALGTLRPSVCLFSMCAFSVSPPKLKRRNLTPALVAPPPPPPLPHVFASLLPASRCPSWHVHCLCPCALQGVLPAVVPAQLRQLLSCAGPFEAAYRSASLARLSDAVVTAFPGSSRSLPSPADVQKCIGWVGVGWSGRRWYRISGNQCLLWG